MGKSANDNAHPASASAVATPRRRGIGSSSDTVSVVNTETSTSNEAAQAAVKASASEVSAPKTPTKGRGRPRADGQLPYHHGPGPAPAGYRNFPDGHPKALAKQQQAQQQAQQQGRQESFQDQDLSVQQEQELPQTQAPQGSQSDTDEQTRNQDQAEVKERERNQDQAEKRKRKYSQYQAGERREEREVQQQCGQEQPPNDIRCKQELADLYSSRDQSHDAIVSVGVGGVRRFPVHRDILLANCNIRRLLIVHDDTSIQFGVDMDEFRDGRIFGPVLGHLYQQKYTNYSDMPLPWHVAVLRAAHVVKLPDLVNDVVGFFQGWTPRLGATRRMDMEILIVTMTAAFTESRYDPSQRLQMEMARMGIRHLDELRHIPSFKKVLTPDCGFMGKELAEAVEKRDQLQPIYLVQCSRQQCKQYFPLGHVDICTKCGMPGGDWSKRPVGKYIDGSIGGRSAACDLIQCPEIDCRCFMPTCMFRNEEGTCVSCGKYREGWTKLRNERRWESEPRFDLRFWDTRGQKLMTELPNLHQHCNCPKSLQN